MYETKNEFLKNYFLVTSGTESITYNDFEILARQFKEILKPRKVAFVVCTNTVGSYTSLPILIRNGVVPLLLDRHIKPEYLQQLIYRYEPEYLLLPAELRKAYSSWNLVRNLFNYVLLHNSDQSSEDVHHDLCLLLTTSGSTGNPKLVRLSHLNLSSNATAISNYLGILSSDRVISSLPMNYSYGLSVINSHFKSGAAIVLTEYSIIERNFWNTFTSNCVTSFNGVPQTYEALLKMRFYRMNLPSLKTMTQAGGKLSEPTTLEVIRFCTVNETKFFVMYGQTEASPRMSFVPPSMLSSKIGSIGIPIPGGKLSLRNEADGVIHTENTVGELCYEGENVFMGYAEKRSDLSRASETSGFLRTGDLAVRDSDGFYSIVGRLNRFVKLFGIRVNLDDLERHLNLTLSECACTGTQDQIKIFTTHQSDLDRLRTVAADFTGLNRQAFVSVFIESIPLTESGKVKYSALQ